MPPHPHTAVVSWRRVDSPEDFAAGRYSRQHTWGFDGGLVVDGSPSPFVVKEPWSDAAAIDPEEAFVASISSCHMLTFIYVAQRAGFIVDSYEDHAEGLLTKHPQTGAMWISDVKLRVKIEYSGGRTPSPSEEDHLHHQAHEQCFIANSVKSKVEVVKG